MTQVVGPVSDVTFAALTDVWTFTGYMRADDGGVILDTPRPVIPAGGILTVTLAPGPVRIDVAGHTLTALVPEDDCTLQQLVEASIAYPPDTDQERLNTAVATWLNANLGASLSGVFIFSEEDPDGPPEQYQTVHVNTHTGDFFNWDTEAWVQVGNLRGPAGVTGNAAPASHGDDEDYGRPDVDGAVIWVGTVVPENAIEGDIYFDITGDPPDITTTSLPAMNLGVPFASYLACLGTTPIAFAVLSGALPDGLTLSTDGQVYGTPEESGAYSFTVRATNGFGTNDQELSGTVGAAIAPTITTTELPSLNQSEPIAPFTLAATGSVPMTWAVTSGSLPAGLALSGTTGVITGTPSSSGAYSFTITASNAAGSDPQEFSGTIAAAASPTITTTSLGALTVGAAFSLTLTATGATPITWSVFSGSLPSGLTLDDETGEISGTPETDGAYSFVIEAENVAGTDTQSFSGTVDDIDAPVFDAIGPGAHASIGPSTSTSASTSHTATAGGTVLYFLSFFGQSSTAPSITMTYGGVSMTQVGSTQSLGSAAPYYAYGAVFKAEGVAGGAQTIDITFGAGQQGWSGNSISYTGVGTVGSLQTAATTAPSLVQNDVVSAANHTLVQCFLYPWVTTFSISSYNQTSRYTAPTGTPRRGVIIGEAPGAADVDFSATITSGSPTTARGFAVDLAA